MTAPAALAWVLVVRAAFPASATSALFHFDDFPWEGNRLEDPDAPWTYLYRCNGKDYCSQADVWDLRWTGLGREVSTTRNGIDGTFGRDGNLLSLSTALGAGNTLLGDLSFGLTWLEGACAPVNGCAARQGSADDILVSTVPEPGTALLLSAALLGLAGWRRAGGA